MKWLCLGYSNSESMNKEQYNFNYDYDFIEGSEDAAETRAYNLAQDVINNNHYLCEPIYDHVQDDIDEHPSLECQRDSLYDMYLDEDCATEIIRLKDNVDLPTLGRMNITQNIEEFIETYRYREER